MKSTTSVIATPDMSRITPLLRRYAWFEGEAGSTTPEAQTPSTTVTPPVNGGNDEGKKFTQAELDKYAGERGVKAAEAARKKLLEKFGIEDEDADAELLKAAKAKREADKSEVEKAAKAVETEKQRADKLAAELEAERAEHRLERLDTLLNAALKDAGAKDVELSLIGLKARKAKDVEALLDADGKVDGTKVTALVTAAKAAYPDQFGLKSTVPGTGSHRGGTRPDPAREGKEKARQDVKERQRSGW